MNNQFEQPIWTLLYNNHNFYNFRICCHNNYDVYNNYNLNSMWQLYAALMSWVQRWVELFVYYQIQGYQKHES